MTVSTSAGWAIGVKKKSNTFWAFFFPQNTTMGVAILDITLTTKEELLYDVEDGGAFEDSDHIFLELFLISFLFYNIFLFQELSRILYGGSSYTSHPVFPIIVLH